jgi:hypothetical protein
VTDTASAAVLPEFSVGRVLSQTFSTFFSNFPKFFGVGVAFYAPVLLFTFYFTDLQDAATLATAGDFSAVMRGTLIATVLTMAVMAMVQAAISHGALEHQAKRSVSMGAMLTTGLRAFLPLIAASVMVGFLYMLGALLLIIPGIIVLVMMSVTTPVIVAEKKGPIAAMGRSKDLTDGYKWQIFGVFALLFILLYGLMIVAGLAAGLGFMDLAQQTGTSVPYMLWQLASTGAYYALVGSCVAAIYTNLRAAKEGTSADDIADVFA